MPSRSSGPKKGKPIGFLRGDDGRVTSRPGEVDAILQASWAPIYDGNAPEHRLVVVEYLPKYREYLHIA